MTCNAYSEYPEVHNGGEEVYNDDMDMDMEMEMDGGKRKRFGKMRRKTRKGKSLKRKGGRKTLKRKGKSLKRKGGSMLAKAALPFTLFMLNKRLGTKKKVRKVKGRKTLRRKRFGKK
jgi:hypothetical protein